MQVNAAGGNGCPQHELGGDVALRVSRPSRGCALGVLPGILGDAGEPGFSNPPPMRVVGPLEWGLRALNPFFSRILTFETGKCLLSFLRAFPKNWPYPHV